MPELIDLHNHILPGIDDGAADLPESLAIARQFVSEGVTQIAATPHLDPERRNGIPAPEVRERVRLVQTALDEAGIPLSVLPGQELFLTPDAPALLDRDVALPLGSSRTVLVEISFDQLPLYLQDTLFRLQVAGYQPILAHPERYAFVRRDPSKVDSLVGSGVALQLTAPSLLGDYGSDIRRTAQELVRRGAYALAASDRHHPGKQRSLAALHERLSEMMDSEFADLLLSENPARLLRNESFIQPESRVPEQRSLFTRIFGSGP